MNLGTVRFPHAADTTVLRRAVQARSARTARAAAKSAAPGAIRAICQPGVPPATIVRVTWTTGGGVVVPKPRGAGPDPPPPAGTYAANALGAAMAMPSQARASPVRAAAARRMRLVRFMTVSFSCERDWSGASLGSTAVHPPSDDLRMSRSEGLGVP